MEIAVLGCGYWGRNLVRNFEALGVLGAVCDPSTEARALAHELAPEAALHATPDAIWDDPSIAGVVLATPAATHAKLGLRALTAGKDLLCEKPLALELQDAKRLAAEAKRRQLVLMVGHVLEYHPAILKLRSLVAEGAIGDVRYIYSNRLNLGKVRKEENILWSFAPHDIGVILRLVDELPALVSASGGAWLQPDVADVTVTQLQFKSGVAAHIFVSWLNPFKEQKLVVVGSERMASFDDVRRRLVLYDQRVDFVNGEPVPVRDEGTTLEFSGAEPLRRECQAFVEAISSRQQPLTDASSALDVLQVLEAAQRSLRQSGEPMELS